MGGGLPPHARTVVVGSRDAVAAIYSRSRTAADDLVRPLQDRPVRRPREPDHRLRWRLRQFPATYGSPRHATASTPATSSSRGGRRKLVGGQADMLTDITLTLCAKILTMHGHRFAAAARY